MLGRNCIKESEMLMLCEGYLPRHIIYYRAIVWPKCAIRNARITTLIPLDLFDVMYVRSLRKIIHPEFLVLWLCKSFARRREAKEASPTKYKKWFGQTFDVNLDLRCGRAPNCTRTWEELKWQKSDSRVTPEVPPQSYLRWLKRDSKLTLK